MQTKTHRNAALSPAFQPSYNHSVSRNQLPISSNTTKSTCRLNSISHNQTLHHPRIAVGKGKNSAFLSPSTLSSVKPRSSSLHLPTNIPFINWNKRMPISAELKETSTQAQQTTEATPPTHLNKKDTGDVASSSLQEHDTQNSIEKTKIDPEVLAAQPYDIPKIISILVISSIVGSLFQHSWIESHLSLGLSIIFILGYIGIIFEEIIEFNKAGVALVMAVAVWATLATGVGGVDGLQDQKVIQMLSEKCAEVSEVIYFLIGAMTIVEIVDIHQGFSVITDLIRTNNKKFLLWIIGLITFFMSSVLDNLTTTIVMVSLLKKLVADPEERKLYGATVVLAANAGGVWTPIGDVTTTMLWINGSISTAHTITDLFLPSFACLAIALGFLTPSFKGDFERPASDDLSQSTAPPRGKLIFFTGVLSLLSVPIFRTVTNLPPYMGMLAGLGILWIMTDTLHANDENRQYLRAAKVINRIDIAGILFFLGILLSVGGLDSAGLLQQLAQWLNAHIPSLDLVAVVIGILSAVVDNVPLVAATMGMYDLTQFPVDSQLWQLIAYCAGVGGSILIVGSAAGVAFMGMERVDFFWYTKKVSLPALLGFFGGVATYLALHSGGIANALTSFGLN